jgi:8-oxo-dGTP pyrophosphatase MutT (NUDIX family)
VTLDSLKTDLAARLGQAPPFPDLHKVHDLVRSAPSSDAPFSRVSYSPGHFTASAFVLSPDRQELLLILHKKLGLWLQPGGHIEEGDESFVAAARREVREETGIELARLVDPWLDLDVHAIPAYRDVPAHSHYDIRVLLEAESLQVEASSEVLRAKWFRLETLAECQGPLEGGMSTDASVRRVAANLLSGRKRPALGNLEGL